MLAFALNRRQGAARLLITLLLLATGGGVFAQVVIDDAGAVQRRALEATKEQQRERRLREAEEAGRRAPLEEPAAGIRIPEELRDYRFTLRRVELDTSTVLTPAETAEVTSRFEGREIAFAELQQLIDALNALYDAKRVLARAVLPPQRIHDGVVKIRLIEARVAAIKVIDNASTRASYVLKRVKLPRGELLALGELRAELIDFNLRNDVNLRASLEPGTEFGTTDVLLHALEPARWDAQLAFDNAGAESVGRERLALNLTARSLTGFRDRISAAAIFSEGSRTASLLVDAPAGRWGTRLGAGFDASDIEIIDGPLSAAEVEGDAHTLTVQATHPFIVHPAWRLDGLLAYRAKHSSTDFFSFEIADIEVRSLEYGASLTRFDPYGSWYTEHMFTSGFEGLGGDKSFLTYRGEVQRWQRLSESLLLRARVQGQWADDDLLPPSEQFQLGGHYTVRGFREGLLIGDSGYLASLELRMPLRIKRLLGTRIQGFAQQLDGKLFVDHGGAFPFKGAGLGISAADYLTAAGFGIELRPIDGMSAALTWSFPMGFRDDGERYRFMFLVQFGLPTLASYLRH